MVIPKKTIIFQDSRGSNILFWKRGLTYSRGGPTFSRGGGGGPIAFSYRTCDLSGGV